MRKAFADIEMVHTAGDGRNRLSLDGTPGKGRKNSRRSLSRKRRLLVLGSTTTTTFLAALSCFTLTTEGSSWNADSRGYGRDRYPRDSRQGPQEDYNWQQQQQQPPPPPPPPAAATAQSASTSTPIHYQFKARSSTLPPEPQGIETYDGDDLPFTYSSSDAAPPLSSSRGPLEDGDDAPRYASPRRDAIAITMSSAKGRFLLRSSSILVGAGFGAFLGKSLVHKPHLFAVLFAFLFYVLTFFRGPYGELAKALGMMLILALQRSRRIRRDYPTYRHVKSSLRMAPREPFPPTSNPWAYRPRDDDDVDFNMLFSVIAMGFVGSLCGGNLPLIPTWIGALAFGGVMAFATMLPDARGDLARTMGMRVVSLCQEVLDINKELGLVPKIAVVSGKIFDKMMILDRKHRIKDKIVTALSFLYGQATRAVNQAQQQMQDSRPDEEDVDGDARRRGPGRPGGPPPSRRPYPDDYRYDDDRQPPPRRPPRPNDSRGYER